MSSSKQRLIERLEQLQTQIDKLKQHYIEHYNAGPAGNQSTEKMVQQPLPLHTDALLQEKDQKLLEMTIRTGKANKLYKTASSKFKSLIDSGKTTFSVDDLKEIQLALDKIHSQTDHWEIFRQKFSAIHKNFFDKLKAAHPDLTKTEQKFCAFIRIQMNSAQIASVLNISKEAIRKNRYRIRKKIGLKTTDSLEEYINRF